MDKNSPLVTIIIPIYNVYQYIDRGINNILSQSYKNIEIILVDDGSTDGSGELCDNISKGNQTIRVFHKPNQGAGSARNVGIDNAQGDYIYFFDIDDLCSNFLIELNVKLMEKENVDFVLFGFKVTNVEFKKSSTDEVKYQERLITSNKQLKDAFINVIIPSKYGSGFPWNKFYRKSFLDKYQIRYENQKIQQDEVFNLLCYEHLDRAYISSNILYHYFIYEKGNTRSRYIPNRFEIYVSVREHFEKIKKHWDIHDAKFENYLNIRFYKGLNDTLRFNLTHKDCQLSIRQKQNEFIRVLNHPYSKQAINEKLKQTDRSFESNKYLNCYYHCYFYFFLFWVYFFRTLRIILHKI